MNTLDTWFDLRSQFGDEAVEAPEEWPFGLAA